MRLEIVLEDGSTQTIHNVKSYEVFEEPEPTIVRTYNFPISDKPEENCLFEVNPSKIDRSLFQESRKHYHYRQENTRIEILNAFCELDRNPEKYYHPFYTFMPVVDGSYFGNDFEKPEEVRKMAEHFGGHQADEIEQALEWAQRICNGESWEDVCNNPDTTRWYRLIADSECEGKYYVVGGSIWGRLRYPASDITPFEGGEVIKYVTPLIVFKK